MTRETRTFIWGMIMIVVGATAFHNGKADALATRFDAGNILDMVLGLGIAAYGVFRVERTVD